VQTRYPGPYIFIPNGGDERDACLAIIFYNEFINLHSTGLFQFDGEPASKILFPPSYLEYMGLFIPLARIFGNKKTWQRNYPSNNLIANKLRHCWDDTVKNCGKKTPRTQKPDEENNVNGNPADPAIVGNGEPHG
jgi:hypothetical protein